MVNLDKKDTKVWLVKIPTFLFDKIQKLDDEAEIGKLRIYKEYFYFCNIRPQILRGKSEPKVELGLSVDQEWAQDLPKDYQVKFTNTNPINEYVFTEMGDVALEVSGKVQYEATLGPMNGEDQEYKKIMRSRTIDATTRNRNTMVMEAKEAKSVGLSRLMEKSTISFGKKKEVQDKRERLPRSDVLDILFTEFEKYPYWSFKAIAEVANQPHAWLKECLAEVAVLVKRGPYAGMYQLLPEYRKGE